MMKTKKLSELAGTIRSKNAGVNQVTFDVIGSLNEGSVKACVREFVQNVYHQHRDTKQTNISNGDEVKENQIPCGKDYLQRNSQRKNPYPAPNAFAIEVRRVFCIVWAIDYCHGLI